MKKELYEKPKMELVSLVDVDIITASAGEGGDVPVENNEIFSNDINEIDNSPWTKNDSINNRGFFSDLWDALNEYSLEDNTQNITPTENEVQEEAPVEEFPVEETIPEDAPVDNGVSDINE